MSKVKAALQRSQSYQRFSLLIHNKFSKACKFLCKIVTKENLTCLAKLVSVLKSMHTVLFDSGNCYTLKKKLKILLTEAIYLYIHLKQISCKTEFLQKLS